MFKRRFTVLGAVAVLVMTGLGGSAMAAGEPPVPGAEVTCTTIDGKPVAVRVIEDKWVDDGGRAYPAIPSDSELRTIEKGELHVTKLLDGEGVSVESVPVTELPPGDDVVSATVPLQATDVDGKPRAARGTDFEGKAIDVTKLKGDGILCVAKKK